jgi:hypothetical protein
MDIKSIIKIFFFILIIGSLYYIYTVKIPILCLTCEESGTFTRCISGTGNGTPTCEAYKLQKKILSEVEGAYNTVTNQFGTVTGAFDEAYQKIIQAKKTLTDSFAKIASLDIPNIPSINIPNINNLSCSINFDGIPAVDVCKTGVAPSVNQGAIMPINKSLDGLQTQINTVVGQLNNTITPINTSINGLTSTVNGIVDDINSAIRGINDITMGNIPTVKKVNIPNINSNIGNTSLPQLKEVNLSCDINIPELIKEKIGSTTLDVCGLLIDQINKNLIPQLNNSFKIIGESINIAIVNINNGIRLAIETIQNGISTAITMLQNQLDALNIFGKLSEKVVELVSKIEKLNPMGLIKTYILPYIQAYFPFATLSDTVTFLMFMLLVPFIIPLFLIINSLIDLIPDFDIGASSSNLQVTS